MFTIKSQKGFTLIEMMIVLLIISVLVLIAIPNVTKHSSTIDQKGCEAFIKMAQGQLQAYLLDHKDPINDISVLVTNGYLPDNKCPDGTSVAIEDGKVVAAPNAGNGNN
ncbi:competence type IV pilus major pilin ComGC [Sporosarcina sp. OR05]